MSEQQTPHQSMSMPSSQMASLVDESQDDADDNSEQNNDHQKSVNQSLEEEEDDEDDEDDDDDDSPVLNRLNTTEELRELEGIVLLRQIFPDETTQELKRMHYDHVRANAMPKEEGAQPT
jgi:hypothetical protein